MAPLDLLGGDTILRKVASTRGGEYAGPCPWCGGRDRFRVWPNANKPGYWCRQCGKKGDAIQYLRDRDGLGYREACERLHLLPRAMPTRRPPTPPPATVAPSSLWQARARELVEEGEARMWTPAGAKALAYLHTRGFTEATLREAHVGYHPCNGYEAPERWGMPAGHKAVWIPRRILLPCFVRGEIWKVWVRRPTGEPKYVALAGSRNALYGADTVQPGHLAMLVEGIFDALAIRQAAGDLVAGVAKDPAEMLQAGVDLRGWVQAGLQAHPIPLLVTAGGEHVCSPSIRSCSSAPSRG